MTDYTIFYKQELAIDENWGPDENWDLFISAYVPDDRTRQVFDKADATHKVHYITLRYITLHYTRERGREREGEKRERDTTPHYTIGKGLRR